MKTRDLLRISVRQVVRQGKRTLGVALAIALGTAGLIAVATMGDEVKNNLNRDLDLLGGATVIRLGFEEEVHPGSRPQWFRSETVEAVRDLDGVETASLATGDIDWLPVLWEDRFYAIPIQGVDEYYWHTMGLSALEGRLLDQQDLAARSRVCVMGLELAENLFGSGAAVGRLFSIRRDLYEVVGVVGGLQIRDRARFAFLPLGTLLDRGEGCPLPDRLYVRCRTWDDVEPVAAAIPGLVAANQPDEYLRMDVAWGPLERIKTVVWWVELFIYLSIAATLVLGGFGIWSGMMTSVAARTREIGLKKAMGAEDMDIMKQFLAESLALGLGSAALGVGLARLVVAGLGSYLGSAPPWPVFNSYAGHCLWFSALLALAAGFYPALRASRMDVVTAIRYE
ncbi:MAG: ABC transporter permease [Desulfovibrionaceae bacterium]|nr:ABC transporter permease [Desulfovibrionaceae bacterium]